MGDNTGFAATGEDTASLTAVVRSLLDQLTLARASELARAGQYAEAKKVLAASGAETESTPAALDLLARMRAQQGDLAGAEKLWTRASQLDPSNGAYSTALRCAAALQQNPGRLRIALPLLACIVLAVTVFMWWLQAQNAKPSQGPSTQSKPAQVIVPSDNEASAPQPTTATESSEQKAVQPIENDINVQGVTVTKASNVLQVSFDEGLFERGVILTPDARKVLKQLGDQLRPYAATSAIEIVGVTDNLQVRRNLPYPDNASLAVERARVVYDFLRLTSGLDSQIFTIGSSREHLAFPVNGARNRTVVLRISTRQR